MSALSSNQSYQDLLATIKKKVQESQVKAVVAVNTEMLLMYWEIGLEIINRQQKADWGADVIGLLSKDLKKSFPGMQGFSVRNLKYMRRFAREYPDFKKGQQPVAQIGWSHNIMLLQKISDKELRVWYAQKAVQHGWSRSVMLMQIERGLHLREGKAVTNFTKQLPSPQSDMAQQALKDPYILDFLSLEKEFLERELEDAIVKHITMFLLELGEGFAFVGRQYPVTVSDKDYRIDLLFYNIKLRCYMAIELKANDFKPEYAGKMNFYLSALDDKIKEESDQPSIGLILCKNKDATIAKYALRNLNTPIGISTFETTNALPENFKSRMPSIEDLERELEDAAREVRDEEE